MWTEQIGFVAANATIEKLEKYKINKKKCYYRIKNKKNLAKLRKKK